MGCSQWLEPRGAVLAGRLVWGMKSPEAISRGWGNRHVAAGDNADDDDDDEPRCRLMSPMATLWKRRHPRTHMPQRELHISQEFRNDNATSD